MATDTLTKIKLALRVSHSKLDEDIQADIDACLADLEACGVVRATTDDPLIYAAVKLWCKASYTDDPDKGAEYLRRYESMKGSMMMTTGYGLEAGADE